MQDKTTRPLHTSLASIRFLTVQLQTDLHIKILEGNMIFTANSDSLKPTQITRVQGILT